MDMTLKRSNFFSYGIFSVCGDSSKFWDTACMPLMVTLEHSYENDSMAGHPWVPKLENGVYKCVRGIHRLKDMKPFETFEVTGVPGHSGILFHVGNYNKDSEGCILVGHKIAILPGGEKMISGSRDMFAKFMQAQAGCDEFTLTVTE